MQAECDFGVLQAYGFEQEEAEFVLDSFHREVVVDWVLPTPTYRGIQVAAATLNNLG